MSLPSFDADDSIRMVKEKPSRVVREQQGSVKKPYPCKHPGCKDAFGRKQDLTNHMKTHQKGLLDAYECDMAMVKLPTTSPIWDTKNEWYINGVKFPKGWKLHKIVALQSTITHKVSGDTTPAITVILIREDKKDD